jgi:hypothetical protein
VTSLKITRFLGTAPKNASELLPDTAAQVSRNTKLYSGDLIPYPQPAIVASAQRPGNIRTLYALRNPQSGELAWLSWGSDVAIATPAADDSEEQRFYYAGDGTPKVSTYALATAGAPPYPTQYYDLGLPLPDLRPTATATSFSPVASASFARDAGNNVTLVTTGAHNLKSGATATISGFTYRTGTYSQSGTTITVTIVGHQLSNGAEIFLEFTSGNAAANKFTVTVTGLDTFTVTSTVSLSTSGDCRWDIRDLNITTEITVVSDDTITYFSPGPQVGTTASTEGRVDLGDQIQARSYLYTWYTPWGEESIGSEPTEPLYIKEGQIVTVENLPATQPGGVNFIRGIRLYRTLSGTTDAEYFRLKTLWFPNTVASVSRAAGISQVTLAYPHNFLEDDRFKLSGCSDTSFDITDGVVFEIVDQYTFTYVQADIDTAVTPATGTIYYDISENPPDDDARYWGDGGDFRFVDDFSYRSLLNTLGSTNYDPPPEDLQGLTVFRDNIFVGFVGNDLYFSQPGVYHAWPTSYKRSFESRIVGVSPIGGNLLVLTENYPYLLSGNDPAVMSQARLSSRYPCLNRRSIVETSFGVVWATHDGLAVYAPSVGGQLLTRRVHASDTWNEALDPSTLVGVMYKDTYIASHDTASIIFENDEKVGPSFVDDDFAFSAAWYDSLTNNLYVVSGRNGDIYQWDDLTQPSMVMRWKSKTFITKEYTNIGAARVVADYPSAPVSPFWSEADTDWELTDVFWDAADPLTFRLYVDKALKTEVTLSDSNMFRLPAGYRSDTFEVEVEGTARVRAIHLGETPTALRKT